MRIGVTGASGFLGQELVRLAVESGHEVVGFSRNPGTGSQQPGWSEARRFGDSPDVTGLDALVHLAGEPIAGIWTASKRERIRRSRVEGTSAFAKAIAGSAAPPRVLVCASATGYYGDRGDEELDETKAPGEGFLASVVRDWEKASRGVGGECRVVNLRFGMILGSEGGSLPIMGKVFRLGLGGRVGNGRQWMPWVHVADAARLALAAVENQRLEGAVNTVSPGAVRNAEFTSELASAVHRPALIPVPSGPLRLALGDLSELLLFSQRVVPAAAGGAGFEFKFPGLDGALHDVFG